MNEVDVIDKAPSAAALLDPLRSRVLLALGEPGSASSVAAQLGLARQKVNYHVRALEDLGLVRFVEDRPKRGLTERVVVATARSFALAPEVLGSAAVEPTRVDRLSARYLVALAGRTISEVGRLVRRADAAGARVATLSIDTDLRFASADDRAAFTADLGQAVTALAARYHDESAPNGRWHRLVVMAHPVPAENVPGRVEADQTDHTDHNETRQEP